MQAVSESSYFIYEIETREKNQVIHMDEAHYFPSDRKFGSSMKSNGAYSSGFSVSSVPNCGQGCIWKTDLIISFGVWCIHSILNLSIVESRPELWGKYTYVLNRLQVNYLKCLLSYQNIYIQLLSSFTIKSG